MKDLQSVVKSLDKQLIPTVRANGGLSPMVFIPIGDAFEIKPLAEFSKRSEQMAATRLGQYCKQNKRKEVIVVVSSLLADPTEVQKATPAIGYIYLDLLDYRTQTYFRPYELEGDSIIFLTDIPFKACYKPNICLDDFIFEGHRNVEMGKTEG